MIVPTIALIAAIGVGGVIAYWWAGRQRTAIVLRSHKSSPANHAQMLRDAAEAQGCEIAEWAGFERGDLHGLVAYAIDRDTGERYQLTVCQLPSCGLYPTRAGETP